MRGLAIVIPARNEEELIGPCLESLRASALFAHRTPGGCSPRLQVVVVIDGSVDRTSAIAGTFSDVTVVEMESSDRGNVGRARASGVVVALDHFREEPAHSVWIANTDADSQVPLNWVARHMELAELGADVVLGTVRPNFDDLSKAQIRAWTQTHSGSQPTGRIYGANLGIRADVYRAAGGFSPVTEHEDVDLVTRARACGASIIETRDHEVLTSGRRTGRTPGGFAGYLRSQLSMPSSSSYAEA
ncbi:glycosyltransferase [Subtercola frigoramans]|nr:glycosyltransferase [Subtercola frigoramans]